MGGGCVYLFEFVYIHEKGGGVLEVQRRMRKEMEHKEMARTAKLQGKCNRKCALNV
jgi:hypothetical protein